MSLWDFAILAKQERDFFFWLNVIQIHVSGYGIACALSISMNFFLITVLYSRWEKSFSHHLFLKLFQCYFIWLLLCFIGGSCFSMSRHALKIGTKGVGFFFPLPHQTWWFINDLNSYTLNFKVLLLVSQNRHCQCITKPELCADFCEG